MKFFVMYKDGQGVRGTPCEIIRQLRKNSRLDSALTDREYRRKYVTRHYAAYKIRLSDINDLFFVLSLRRSPDVRFVQKLKG